MGKIVINQTDTGQKVLLDTNEEGVTGGYYDRQDAWHEFGGSSYGNSIKNPIITVNLVNNTEFQYNPGDYEKFYRDGYICSTDGYVVPPHKTVTFSTVTDTIDGTEYIATFNTKSCNASDVENLTVEKDGDYLNIVVTDPAQNASLTLTYNATE